MEFEEFFRKKKINLVAFEQAEQALFSEFKIHFEQMGEKSFDHTKKYWFNKLRLRYPAPPEVKTEKPAIDNPLAEQTITESLVESSSPQPNIGFKPKFKAGLTKSDKPTPEPPKEEPATPTPPVGFKPRFKAGITKPAESTTTIEPEKPAENAESSPAANTGFKPRFKAEVTKPATRENSDKPKKEE